MKRGLYIFLAGLLLFIQFGVHVHTHYCMDRLTHLDLLAIEKADGDLCACSEAYEESGCCHDVEVHTSEEIIALQASHLVVGHNLGNFLLTWVQAVELRSNRIAWLKLEEQTIDEPPPQWMKCWEITMLRI